MIMLEERVRKVVEFLEIRVRVRVRVWVRVRSQREEIRGHYMYKRALHV